MSFNTFGKLFRFSTWGESHGPAIGCVVDGCPPNINLKEQDIQIELDKRKPGQSKFTTQRKEDDKVQILSGIFEGKTTGTPISLIIYNKDMRSKDYGNIKNKFRPGHADYTYFKKYGIRDYTSRLMQSPGRFIYYNPNLRKRYHRPARFIRVLPRQQIHERIHCQNML